MTTTLRPIGPERTGPGGQRSRAYEVCVNSRPVGAVELGTDSRFGPGRGRIHALRIDEPDRRRGRGTVAALAAEEVLRDWGCRRVEVSVPADAVAALRLTAALGYTERSRLMTKRLEGAPALPQGSESRAMTGGEFRDWLAAAKAGYARIWTERGGVPEEQARAKAEADLASGLADGLDTPGAVLRVLSHRGADVGTLWLALGQELPDGSGGYVFDVEVAAAHRGRGHGRSLMLVAERECASAGAELLGLNVFADNPPALRLYESLGYLPARIHLSKELI